MNCSKVFRLLSVLFVIILFGSTIDAQAGRYELVDGKQYAVCRDLVENLNMHPEWPPLACEFKVDTADKKFSTPRWLELKPSEHFNIIENLVKERARPHQYIKIPGDQSDLHRKKIWKQSEPNLKKWAKNGESRLFRSEFDINHDGNRDVVYRYYSKPCDSSREIDFNHPSYPKLYVANENGLLPDHSFGALVNVPHDVFFYHGRSYLTWWTGRFDQGTASIGIYETSSPIQAGQYTDINVCTLKYFLARRLG